jgi:hypothetical protein
MFVTMGELLRLLRTYYRLGRQGQVSTLPLYLFWLLSGTSLIVGFFFYWPAHRAAPVPFTPSPLAWPSVAMISLTMIAWGLIVVYKRGKLGRPRAALLDPSLSGAVFLLCMGIVGLIGVGLKTILRH